MTWLWIGWLTNAQAVEEITTFGTCRNLLTIICSNVVRYIGHRVYIRI